MTALTNFCIPKPIVATEPLWGPESIEGHFEGYLSAAAVLDRLTTFDEPFDALVMAGSASRDGRGRRSCSNVPVLDIAESAAQMAMMLGHSYGVVTTLDRAVPQIRDRLLTAGLLGRCAGVRGTGLGVLELEADRERTVELLGGVPVPARRHHHRLLAHEPHGPRGPPHRSALPGPGAGQFGGCTGPISRR